MQLDAKALAAATAEIVEKHVAAATAPLIERIAELERRQPEKGDQGPQGERGADGVGLAGAIIDRDGKLIVTLADGSARDLGPIVGKDGERGAQGEAGRDGTDGRDGADADMEALTKRIDELVAAIPVPKDGLTPEIDFNIADNGIGVLSFDIGDIRHSFEIPIPYSGQARGLYDAEGEYRALDVVSFNGSEWRAKVDNPGPLPGEGWMLSAQRGKRGDRGEKGERGQEGKAGKDGAQPIALKFDAEAMQFVMILDDGNALEADIQPVIEAIAEAARNG